MSKNATRRKIIHLLNETVDAYKKYDCVNADYASFAAMILPEFRTALGKPDMSAQELRRMLRNGESQHRAQTTTPQSWSIFMANYVSQNANINIVTATVEEAQH